MERREYTRITTELSSRVSLPGGAQFTGTTRDLSFGGAYMDCDAPPGIAPEALPQPEECVLTLGWEIEGRPVSVAIRAHLVELTGPRAGLRFCGAEQADYEHLRGYLLQHAPDYDALLREIQDFPNPAFPAQGPLPAFADWLGRMLERLQNRA